jgi:hypothetical protein
MSAVLCAVCWWQVVSGLVVASDTMLAKAALFLGKAAERSHDADMSGALHCVLR